jgi:hypothetical protein
MRSAGRHRRPHRPVTWLRVAELVSAGICVIAALGALAALITR